jgi:glutathione S-transferase
LTLKPSDEHFPDYLYWYHFANASQQPTMATSSFFQFAGVSPDNPAQQFADQRLHAMLKQTDDRLKDNQWLAGPEFTAADVMSVYGLSTQRYFGPQVSLAPYQHIVRWLKDCSQRDGYKRAMAAGDPDMEPMIGADPQEKSLFDGGVNNDHWQKK